MTDRIASFDPSIRVVYKVNGRRHFDTIDPSALPALQKKYPGAHELASDAQTTDVLPAIEPYRRPAHV